VAAQALPTFDLVVATVDRAEPLVTLLRSLAEQRGAAFEVIVADQNADDRVARVIAAHPSLAVERIEAPRGLSRARNAALGRLTGDVVAFPDDDCTYPSGLLQSIAVRLAAEPGLDGIVGREVSEDGTSSPSWATDAAVLTRENLWNRAISFTIFLRRAVIEEIGGFDERLGLGAGAGPWESGEEIDLLVRAVDAGARIAYDPAVVVRHASKDVDRARLRALGRRDGTSVGFLLRKHGYPARTVARMLVRPAGGVAASLARGDVDRAAFHAATLRGRLTGLRGGR
jgi:glycosyltransferase involved in cell wall biosynthesis